MHCVFLQGLVPAEHGCQMHFHFGSYQDNKCFRELVVPEHFVKSHEPTVKTLVNIRLVLFKIRPF